MTKAEILSAIHNPLGVHTVTGIKAGRARRWDTVGQLSVARITDMIEEDQGSETGRCAIFKERFLHVYRESEGREMRNVDVVIIGGGPAGLASAIELYKKRSNRHFDFGAKRKSRAEF